MSESKPTPAQEAQRREALPKGTHYSPWRSAPMVGSQRNWKRHRRMQEGKA